MSSLPSVFPNFLANHGDIRAPRPRPLSMFAVDDPLDQGIAMYYGIVMGTSHQEPMMRSTPSRLILSRRRHLTWLLNHDSCYFLYQMNSTGSSRVRHGIGTSTRRTSPLTWNRAFNVPNHTRTSSPSGCAGAGMVRRIARLAEQFSCNSWLIDFAHHHRTSDGLDEYPLIGGHNLHPDKHIADRLQRIGRQRRPADVVPLQGSFGVLSGRHDGT